ncbi:hypothetical protein [Halovulum sp. GXIMD14793]
MTRLAPILGSIFLILVTGIVAEWVMTMKAAPPRIMPASAVVSDAPQTPQSQAAIATARPASYYSAITERPLFEVTRRPVRPDAPPPEPKPEPVAVPEPEPEPKPVFPDVALMGVLMTGDTPRALLGLPGQDANWMRQGQEMAGWTVTKIAADHVEFKNQEEVVLLDLYKKRAE